MAQQEQKKEEEYVPCNFEYEKAVFFWKLSDETTTETMKDLLSKYGPLDYCYVVSSQKRAKLGRAKFKPVALSEDKGLSKEEIMKKARQRAVDAVAKAVADIHEKKEVNGKVIKIQPARPCDMKEYQRYGDY